MERDIQNDVKINRFNLEVEAEEHASTFWYWSEKAADCRKVRDLAKIDLKESESKLALDFRSGVVEMGCKITDSSVSASVDSDSGICHKKRILTDAEYALNKAEAAAESMRHKKSGINNLIELYTMQYYSTPGAQRPKPEQVIGDDYRKKMNEKRKEKETN